MTTTATEEQVPMSVYRAHVWRAQNTGDYFIFSRSYIKIMTPIKGHKNVNPRMGALFLQDLLNFGCMKADEDGWFVCSRSDLQETLDWDKDSQADMLAYLCARGFVKVEGTVGGTRNRAIWIDIKVIETALDAAGFTLDKRRKVPTTPYGKYRRPPSESTDTYMEVRGNEEEKNSSSLDATRQPLAVFDPLEQTTRRQKTSAAPGNPEQRHPRLIKTIVEGDGFCLNTKAETKGEELAVLLYQALAVNGVFAVPGTYKEPNLTSWGQRFTKQLAAHSYEQLAALIEQHRLHFKDTWWIILETANTFCNGIRRLEKTIARQADIDGRTAKKANGNVSVTNPTDLPISDKARELATRVENAFDWPKGSDAQLPSIMQPSMDNFEDFCDRLVRVYKKTKGNDNEASLFRFTEHLLNQFESTDESLMGWFEDQYKDIAGWDAWSGVLRPFSIQHKLFPKWINWYRERFGTNLPTDKLFAALNAVVGGKNG